MGVGAMLRAARVRAGITEAELARRSGTVQSAVSAYEQGRKSPTASTLERLAATVGHRVALEPDVTWTTRTTRIGRPFDVPDRLPRLAVEQAMARVTMPVQLMWSGQRRVLDLSVRADRVDVYHYALVEGTAGDIERYVDGALLVDLWDDLLLPPEVEQAWAPLIEASRGR